jgi:hypothetical protein
MKGLIYAIAVLIVGKAILVNVPVPYESCFVPAVPLAIPLS